MYDIKKQLKYLIITGSAVILIAILSLKLSARNERQASFDSALDAYVAAKSLYFNSQPVFSSSIDWGGHNRMPAARKAVRFFQDSGPDGVRYLLVLSLTKRGPLIEINKSLSKLLPDFFSPTPNSSLFRFRQAAANEVIAQLSFSFDQVNQLFMFDGNKHNSIDTTYRLLIQTTNAPPGIASLIASTFDSASKFMKVKTIKWCLEYHIPVWSVPGFIENYSNDLTAPLRRSLISRAKSESNNSQSP